MTPYLDPLAADDEVNLLNRELFPRIRFGMCWYQCCFFVKPINIGGRKMFRVSPLLRHANLVVARDTIVRIAKPVTFLGQEAEALLSETYQVENTGRLSPFGHDKLVRNGDAFAGREGEVCDET